MTAFELAPYTEEHAADWDDFIADAPMATFLHSRRFLSYQDRFIDQSLVLLDSQARLVALFPAAIDPADERRVVSHPGTTFGGLVHHGSIGGNGMVDAILAIREHYQRRGFAALRYKAVPHIYHRRPSADDIYALTRLEARLYRCDLSCAIDLADRPRPSDRRRRGERKALREGVDVRSDSTSVDDFWPVLEENLQSRHGVRPTHTAAEIALLLRRFPEAIEIVTATADGAVLAGVVLFITHQVVHAQYIGSTEHGRAVGAVDAALEHCIRRASSSGKRFFDFGISTVDDGRVLNAGLHQFKAEFGGGGVVHLFFELDLAAGDEQRLGAERAGPSV